jgi:hypothetical protein
MNEGRVSIHARARTSAVATALLGLACIPTAPPSALSGPTIQYEARLGDCSTAEQGLEFAPFMISDFETGMGQYSYTYVDNTAAISPSGYQQPTEPGQHCVDDPGHNVFHLNGGPFLGWGGGFGVAMQHIVAQTCVGSPLPDYCIPPGAEPEVTGLYLDASQWDGVAVWARRGAGGQPLLRVLIGNKYTDDDVSFTMYNYYPNEPRYCERVRECACINGLDCTFSQDEDHGGPVGVVPGGGYYCGAPGIVSGPDVMAGAAGNGQRDTNTCGTTRCNDPYPAYASIGIDTHLAGTDRSDPEFANRPCRPFTYRSGVTSNFCYGENDPDPAQTDQQCGDHWTYPLKLTTDWQLFLVPFSWMGPQGFAKRFTFFDLTSVSVARFTWDAGPVDFYIDNWRFYRVKRPAADGGN